MDDCCDNKESTKRGLPKGRASPPSVWAWFFIALRCAAVSPMLCCISVARGKRGIVLLGLISLAVMFYIIAFVLVHLGMDLVYSI